jgi:hypothetical protein
MRALPNNRMQLTKRGVVGGVEGRLSSLKRASQLIRVFATLEKDNNDNS